MCGQPGRDPDLTRLTTILFIWGKNRRSATTEEIFAGMGGIEVSSACMSLMQSVQRAPIFGMVDQVFVMEQR